MKKTWEKLRRSEGACAVAAVVAVTLAAAAVMTVPARASINTFEDDAPCGAEGRPTPGTVRLSHVKRVQGAQGEESFQVAWPARAQLRGSLVAKPESGGTFDVARCLSTGQWAVVGRGIVGNQSGAVIEGEAVAVRGSELGENASAQSLAQAGNLYWRPMVGDVVLPIKAEIQATIRITPKLRLAVSELFSRNAAGYSTELSDVGRERIKESIEQLRGVSGRLVVESYAQIRGQRAQLRRTTQARANAVAQFIARSFRIPPEKLLAIGLGGEGLSKGFSPVAQWPEQDPEEAVVLRVLSR